MAHSNPNGIANLGDAQRVARAIAYFVAAVLPTDPRVGVFYRRWRDAFNAFFDSVTDEVIGDREVFAEDPFAAEIARCREAQQQAFDGWRHTMQDETAAFIRNEIPELSRWIVWLAPKLQDTFVVIAQSELDPGTDCRVDVPVRISERTPKGRQLPRDGQDLERNVLWFYRAKVKQPRDSIKGLAREHVAAQRRSPDAGNLVRSGIDQVTALFDVAARNYEPERRQP